MAAADVASLPILPEGHAVVVPGTQQREEAQKHNVQTVLNYYKDPEDGTPPAPFYIRYVKGPTLPLTVKQHAYDADPVGLCLVHVKANRMSPDPAYPWTFW
jgi:hypothetical protein